VNGVTLQRASIDDESLLENLLELYMHDMSEFFPLKLNSLGRFCYDRLPLYWSQPESRWAYIVRVDEEVAGCALVAQGSVASTDAAVFDLNEFFVLRSHRRQGIGQRAANLLWNKQPGKWIVRVEQTNQRALHFWDTTIRSYAGTSASTSELTGKTNRYLVYRFASGDF
jgi:predicted acetyltransferase